MRQNRWELHQCQSCRRLRGICAERYGGFSTCAPKFSHGFQRPSACGSCIHCRLPVLFFRYQAPLRVVVEAILSTMGSHIFRLMLARAIQASPFDVPCFTNMNFRIRSSHCPNMKMFVPVWADWTRRSGNVPSAVHIVQTPAAEMRKERHTVSHNITVFASTLRTQKVQRVKLTLASQQPKQT